MFFLTDTNVFLLDTSKQRHRLRKKIVADKADLAKVISDYNDLATTCKVVIADALDNKFPWALPDQSGGKYNCYDSISPLVQFRIFLFPMFLCI